MQNSRLTERAPFLAEVDILSLGHTSPRRVWGMDVSEEGMFLQTTHPFRIGDRVSLRFGVHVQGAEEHEVHVRAAEVRWVRPFEPVSVDGRVPGIGLHFVSLDPPARAALRRFAKPAERDEITLPERIAVGHTSDAGLGMLPPPTSSLPPITGSIAAHATSTPREITEEMLAVSLPPFSTPPRAPRENRLTSLPPDEAMDDVFACTALQQLRSKPPRTVPRDVTIVPKSTPPRARSKQPQSLTRPPMHAATDPPAAIDIELDLADEDAWRDHPLAGWRFERAVFADTTKNEPAPSEYAPESARAAEPNRLGLSFDDERPSERSQLPSIIVEPSIFAIESAPPNEPSSGPSPALDQAFFRGEVALAELPTVGERAPSQPRASAKKNSTRNTRKTTSRTRALTTAAVLIVIGTAVGAGLGLAGKKLTRPAQGGATVARNAPASSPSSTPLVPPALASDDAPRAVADIERGVPTRAMPETPPAQKPALAPLAAAPTKTEPAPHKAAPRTKAERPARTDGFRLDIPVGEAKVARTFTLEHPSRVVVDLEGGTLPKESLDGDGKRTERVRFGSPRPGVSRIVVELAEGAKASDVAAAVNDGRLALSFR